MNNKILVVFWLFVIGITVEAEQFVSLKSPRINMRVGPGEEFPVSWVFLRAGLPMMLTAEFQHWKKVRYVDGTEGWMHQNMISGRNTAVVTAGKALLFKRDSESCPIARVEKDVVVRVVEVHKNWVKVDINKIKGWMKKDALWGVQSEREV